jgi:hypothetical protein
MRTQRSTAARGPRWQRIAAGIEGLCGLGLVVIALLLRDQSGAMPSSIGFGLLGLGFLAAAVGQLVFHKRFLALLCFLTAAALQIGGLVYLSPF